MDAIPGTVAVYLDYVGFLHDRLVLRAPGIVSTALTRRDARGDSVWELSAWRDDIDTSSFELHWRLPGLRAEPADGREFVVTGRESGTALRMVVPGDLALGPEVQRRLLLYGLVVLAGLQSDLVNAPPDTDVVPPPRAPLHGSERRSRRAGSHLERVAGYSHIIVRALTAPLGLSPDFADAVFRYAPLHDVGQLVFPDEVMLKPGRLDADEWALMKTHTTRGRAIVDLVIASADPAVVPRPDVLRNIVELHHEALDGSGYPHGLSGDEVPLEARIVTVADVFDALLSKRPYKPDWTIEETLTEMDRMVDAGRLDGRCLTALVTEPEMIEAVAAGGAEPPRMMRT